MGLENLIGGAVGGGGVSAEQLKKEQEDAARAERDKIAQEKGGQEAAFLKEQSQYKAAANTMASGIIKDEKSAKKRFLKGV